MIPGVLISPRIPQAALSELSDDIVALADIDPWDDGTVRLSWAIEPEQWHFLPHIRAALLKFASAPRLGRNYIEDDEDPRDASLVRIRIDTLKEARAVGPLPQEKHYCDSCAAMFNTVHDAPSVTLELPPPLFVPGLFMPDNTNLKFASEPLVEQFNRQGFMKGLELVPTTLVNPSDYRYFGLIARTKLRYAEPFGSESSKRPCQSCGAQSPAHAFFDIFEHPMDPVQHDLDWYCAHTLGPSAPIVTGRVYRWLKGPGAAYVGQPARGKAPLGSRCGWYPEDAKLGYLPERFQKASHEPVEPLRAGEYPLPKPAAKRRKITR